MLKEHLRDELVELLRSIVEGRPPYSTLIAQRILSHIHTCPRSQQQHLKPREGDVLMLIDNEPTRNGITWQLGFSPKTVSDWIKTIDQKLNIRCCSEATLAAVWCGMVRN